MQDGRVQAGADHGSHNRIGIPHNTIHRILREKGMAAGHPKKSRRRERIRFERTHSKSVRHAGYEQLPDGK